MNRDTSIEVTNELVQVDILDSSIDRLPMVLGSHIQNGVLGGGE